MVSTTSQPNEVKTKPRFQLPSPEIAHQIRNAIKLTSAQQACKINKYAAAVGGENKASSVAVANNKIGELCFTQFRELLPLSYNTIMCRIILTF